MDRRYEILENASKAVELYAKEVKMRIACLDSDAPYNLNFDVTLDTRGCWNAPDGVFEFLSYFNDMLQGVTILEQTIDEEAKQRDLRNGDYEKFLKYYGRQWNDSKTT